MLMLRVMVLLLFLDYYFVVPVLRCRSTVYLLGAVVFLQNCTMGWRKISDLYLFTMKVHGFFQMLDFDCKGKSDSDFIHIHNRD